MFDFIMTDEQGKLRDETGGFSNRVPGEMIPDMDNEKIQFPKE